MPRSGSRNNPPKPDLLVHNFSDESPQSASYPSSIELYANKMRKEGMPDKIIDLFSSYFTDVSAFETGFIPEVHISPIEHSQLKHIEELDEYEAHGKSIIKQAIAIKLNGGLGTSMGMQFAKSLLPVKDNKSFLDITMQQALTLQDEHGGSIPLALMNSYSTHNDTLNELRYKDGISQLPLCFVQHKFPKIRQDTLAPAEYPENPEYEWNPPGHGDLFAALYLSGVLDTLLRQGRRYALISNIDNLGATIDMRLLGYMAKEKIPFLMEVTKRTQNDCKGGHIARHNDGHLVLREIRQCHENDLNDFQNIQRHGLFNTNNIWINLVELKKSIHQHGIPKLPLIITPKPINPHDKSSTPVFQLESAMGSAVSYFPGAETVITNRDRFIPVKKTDDLLKVMSDYYLLQPSGKLTFNAANITENLKVDLDPDHYSTFDNIYDKFRYGIPSLTSCSKLGIQGDVIFNPSVSLVGDVSIDNQTGNILMLPNNIKLEGNIEIN